MSDSVRSMVYVETHYCSGNFITNGSQYFTTHVWSAMNIHGNIIHIYKKMGWHKCILFKGGLIMMVA